MGQRLFVVLAIATVGSVFSAETDPARLDPGKTEDRTALLEIVQRSANGKSNQAAKMLAQSGYMDDLLEILETTASYNTMQAIAQTRDERTIPIFEKRIRESPNDRYLVGALAYVHNPKVSAILMDLLRMHPDADRPNGQDMVSCILNAMVLNRTQDAIPLLRQRFSSCGGIPLADRKSDYAVTLLSLGDPVGVQCLSESLPAERLATICDWMSPAFNLLHIEDESIMTPLLPRLILGASQSEGTFPRDCCRVLRVLTRHDFPAGNAAWQKWYKEHQDKHPIYTHALDRAVKLSADTFRKGLADMAAKDETIRWIDFFLGNPQDGFGAHNDFLWKLESHPELNAVALLPGRLRPPPLEKRRDLGVICTIALTSRLREPDGRIFRRDFEAINVTLCIASPTRDEATKKVLLQLAEQACVPLFQYERFFQRIKDSEPTAALAEQ